MHTQGSSLATKAFGDLADADLIVAYEAHQDALRFLSAALAETNGVALLQGPAGSGKTTIVNEQYDWSRQEGAVALVDGAHLTPRQLVTGMLSQFGVTTTTDDNDQLLQQLNYFVTQRARSSSPPLLIIDNVDSAPPSVLRLLNWLAVLDVQGSYAMRIILTGKERLSALLQRDGLRSLARRHPATYSVNPMTKAEVMIYLRTRLIAAGGTGSENVFPPDVCARLHELSRGWPGLLNERAIRAMERIPELQPARPTPRIIVTRDGQTIEEYQLTERQYVIGRNGLADIVIEDGYVSKLHAMLRIYNNAIMLVDLNSTNGTTVNSKIVQKTLLLDNDIIMLGHHRLKIENAPPISAEMNKRMDESDTVLMKTLGDLRRSRARRAITVLKHKPN